MLSANYSEGDNIMKKVLVTGGAGFIGSHIVEKLLEEKYEVIIVDNLISGSKENIFVPSVFYQADINNPELEDVFLKEKPNYVIHQAAQVSVQSSIDDPYNDAIVNIMGTLNLLKLCVKYKVKKFVFASSAAVYGQPRYLPIDENHSTKPISFYGLSKLTSEMYIHLFSKVHDLEYCILRYANVFGPRQNAKGEAGVISIFINRIMRNQQLDIYGDGNQTRDFIYVKDVAAGCIQALQNGENEIINLSSQTQTTIIELAKILSRSRNLQPVYLSAKKGDVPHSCLMNKQAKSKLNWSPAYSLLEGIEETIEYFLKQGV